MTMMSGILLRLLTFVLIVNLALSELVQSFTSQSVQLKPFDDNKYNLRIRHSDGSVLEVIVHKTDPAKYEVKGRLIQSQFSPYGRLFATYRKGKGTKYVYTPPDDVEFPNRK